MSMSKTWLLALIIILSSCRLHPTPSFSEFSSSSSFSLSEVCSLYYPLTYDPQIDSEYYFGKILLRLNNNLECLRPLFYNQNIHTLVVASRKVDIKEEAYVLIIDEEGIKIEYGDYNGYIYALETLAQIIKENQDKGSIPQGIVKDEPRFSHRGIMIDTARHFLSLDTIQQLIETMPMSKLNTLHWHLADDQSFSVKLDSHPELAQYGSFGKNKFYTTEDIRALVLLASKNGIKIVPEITSPSHMRSWALSPTWKAKNITIPCVSQGLKPKYTQQLDPSKAGAIELITEVVLQLDNLFKNAPYIHLGGGDVSYECWDARPTIKSTFMKLHNLATYDALADYIKFQIKQSIAATRKIVFWSDTDRPRQVSPSDIIQFNGNTTEAPSYIKSYPNNQFILSPFNVADLSSGFGNVFLNQSNNRFNSWRGIYQGYSTLFAQIDESRVLGGQLLLWGQYINDDNFVNMVWMRAAAFGQRMWSKKNLPIYQLAQGLVSLQHSLQNMEIDVSPVTSEFCEYQPIRCWPEEITFIEEEMLYTQ